MVVHVTWSDLERDALLASPLLAGLPCDVAEEFLEIAQDRRIRRGDLLYVEDGDGDGAFLVVSGKLKVARPSPDGKGLPLTIAGVGDLLGELALFDGGARHSTATAIQDTVAAWVATPAMLAWLGRHPKASLRMMQLLGARLRKLNDRLEVAFTGDVATRVARALVEQGGRFGRQTAEGLHFTLDLNQDELAHYVRASRERVNQVLVDFSRRGWIRRDGNEFAVLDPQALTRRARYRPEVARRRPSVLPPPAAPTHRDHRGRVRATT